MHGAFLVFKFPRPCDGVAFADRHVLFNARLHVGHDRAHVSAFYKDTNGHGASACFTRNVHRAAALANGGHAVQCGRATAGQSNGGGAQVDDAAFVVGQAQHHAELALTFPNLRSGAACQRGFNHVLNVAHVEAQARSAGRATTEIWEGERKFSVVLRLAGDRRSVINLPATPIALPSGGYATLENVATIRQGSGAMNIAREAGRRTMAIGIFVKGRDMGSIVADMKARVAKNVKIADSYAVTWSGEFENQERAMQRLGVVVPISLLLIFVLLFDAFGSFKTAGLILINVPLALIGGFVALWVFNIPLSVSAAIGFIALSGQAVLNGVVMLSVFQQLRNAGYTVLDAVKEGALQRLRTVLMTAMLAALGLLPMALSHDIGSETQRPLAIVVIGGLVTATLLTLVVLPALYVAWFSNKPMPNTKHA